MPSVIEARGLRFAYVRVPVLEDISFSVEAGDYVGLIGPNGGGKTTLLKLLLGLEKGSGDIKLFGTELAQFKDWHKIGYLAQKSPVSQSRFPVSAEEVVLMGLSSRRGSGVSAGELRQVYDAMQKPARASMPGVFFTICPSASSSAYCWRARWSAGRNCLFWTNLPPRWMRNPARCFLICWANLTPSAA